MGTTSTIRALALTVLVLAMALVSCDANGGNGGTDTRAADAQDALEDVTLPPGDSSVGDSLRNDTLAGCPSELGNLPNEPCAAEYEGLSCTSTFEWCGQQAVDSGCDCEGGVWRCWSAGIPQPCDECCVATHGEGWFCDTTGECVELPPQCCETDDDCSEGYECEGARESWGPGECLPIPTAGDCYRDAHCDEGFVCLGAQPCGCLVDCDWAGPGRCVPNGAPCCYTPSHCAEGEHCIGAQQGGPPGVCKPALDDGTCWGTVDCPQGETCVDAAICPCDADCDMVDTPGTCTAAQTCCATDEECAEDWTCATFPEFMELEGACKPAQTEGMCWDHGDCTSEEVCMGAVPCPCGYDAEGDGCDIPGTCIDKGTYGCCTSDEDCDGDLVCGPGSTCVASLRFGQCWTDSNCYDTQFCRGVTVCPCGALCVIGTSPGSCVPLPAGCCYDDSGCDEGYVCRGHSGEAGTLPGSCVPDHNGPECLGDAACCWEDADCGGDSTCGNAYVCGCIDLCPSCGACAENQMGFCE